MKKKIISILLSACMALTSMPIATMAAEFTDSAEAPVADELQPEILFEDETQSGISQMDEPQLFTDMSDGTETVVEEEWTSGEEEISLFTASAEEEAEAGPPLGAQVTSEVTADFTQPDTEAAETILNGGSSGGASWDKETRTLTLAGVNFEANISTTDQPAIKVPADTTIELSGSNVIKTAGPKTNYGIYANGKLTIEGNGTLTVDASSDAGGGQYSANTAICTDDAMTVNLNETGTLYVKGYTHGIRVNNNNAGYIQNQGTVKVEGGVSAKKGYGIDAYGGLRFNGGKLYATGYAGLVMRAPGIRIMKEMIKF